MSKNIDVNKMNSAQITAQMEALKAQMAALQAVEQTKKQEQVTELNAKIETFPAIVSKILGRDVSKEDFAGMVKAWVKGTLSLNSEANSTDLEKRSKRLTDDEKLALRARLLARAVNKARGTPAEQLSVIAESFGVTYQTAANETYAPNQKQIEEAIVASTVATA